MGLFIDATAILWLYTNLTYYGTVIPFDPPTQNTIKLHKYNIVPNLE